MKSWLIIFLCVGMQLTLVAQSDSSTTDCYDAFFKSSTSIKNKASVNLLLSNGKLTTLAAFMKTAMDVKPEAGLKDLDGDGTKELIVWDYTGGAHCCDEFYFFRNTINNHYTYAGKLFAGNTCVDEQNNFIYNLHELFGYFFTCFACGLGSNDESMASKGLTIIDNIVIRYKKGKLQIQPGDEGLKAKIKKNLAYLKNLGWDGGVKEADFDDGRRKELALNLATYYFSFGKNIIETKKLFTTFYPFKDATKVWTQFIENLDSIKKNNDF